MDTVRNLSTPEKRVIFREQFRKLVETEALRLCGNRARAELLTEYVFLKVEACYAARVLPDYCEPFLVGQVCLSFASTGGNSDMLQKKIETLKTPDD